MLTTADRFLELALVRHRDDRADETFVECRACGEWEDHTIDCLVPRLEAWVARHTMSKIEVIRNATLEREVWGFWFDDRNNRLVLDHYRHETRPTLRHRKWNVQKEYDRLFDRRMTPPLPPDVADEALAQFAASITVTR